MKNSLVLVVGILAFGLLACEGRFPGERALNLEVLNEPYQMRYLNIEGQDYLVVVNTGALGDTLSGSIHFYDVALSGGKWALTRKTEWDLQVPTNVSDFYYEETDGEKRLYVLDRNKHRLLVYDLDQNFSIRKTSNGKDFEIELFENPQRLQPWTRMNGDRYLAILCQKRGSIQFVNLETLARFELEDLQEHIAELPESARVIYEGTDPQMIGAKFEMFSRDDVRIRGISAGEAEGVGISDFVVMDQGAGADPIFVISSWTDDALFGFRFGIFDNSANLLWNPRNAIRGTDSRPGSKEEGIRGLAMDGNQNIYVSNIGTNRLYKVPGTEFESLRAETVKNTKAFAENATTYELNINFDSAGEGVNVSGERFPRLGDLVVNGQGVNETATRAWVIGMESSKRASLQSRVYFVNLQTNAILDTYDFEAGEKPLKLLYFNPGTELLAVTARFSNKIYLFDVSTDSLVEQTGVTE